MKPAAARCKLISRKSNPPKGGHKCQDQDDDQSCYLPRLHSSPREGFARELGVGSVVGHIFILLAGEEWANGPNVPKRLCLTKCKTDVDEAAPHAGCCSDKPHSIATGGASTAPIGPRICARCSVSRPSRERCWPRHRGWKSRARAWRPRSPLQ